MNKTALTKRIILATTLIALGAIGVHKVSAQQVLPLSVVPPKQEVLINPGENFSTSVKFLNQGDAPVSGSLSVVDFIVQDDNGTPVFLDNPQVVGTTTISAKYSAAKWTKLTQDSITIAAKGNVAVPITISVPKNAAPGGRYMAITFQPTGSLTLGNPESAQETPVAIRLASLVYIRVAGPITENATVTKFEGPSFLEYGPVNVSTQIANNGDYHITPKGTIKMTDMFGRVVATSDLDSKNVFPGTSRDYTSNLGEKTMIGKFTVALAATYGDKGQTLASSFTMWVFPWKVTLAVVLALVIIILLITLWYKKIVKKEAKLVEELKEEKTELEALKEKFEDKVTPSNDAKDSQSKSEVPPQEKTS